MESVEGRDHEVHRRERKRKTTAAAAAEFDICRIKTKAQTVVVVEEIEEESIVPP